MTRSVLSVLILVLAPQLVLAQDDHLRSGVSVSGPIPPSMLIGVSEHGGIELESTGAKKTYEPTDLIAWGAFAEGDRGPLALLSDGTWLVGDLLSLSPEEVTLDTRQWFELKVLRNLVQAVLFRLPADPLRRDRLIDRLARREAAHDYLLLTNGDELTGKLGTIRQDDDAFQLLLGFTPLGAEEPVAIPLQNVAAIGFDPTFVENTAPRGSHSLVGLRDGSRLVVANATAASGRAELTLASGLKLRIAGEDLAREVVAWQSLGTSAVYLSDLETTGYKHIPFLTMDWPYENDRNCLGGRLRAGSHVYFKGLGMHSTSRLAYDLEGDYRRLEAELAIDDLSGPRGSVVCKVFTESGDGQWQPAYESPVIRGGQKPVAMSVDLTGVRRIALLVDFAERGDELDHINWLNARLVK